MTEIDYAKARRTGQIEVFRPNEITSAKGLRKMRRKHKGRPVQKGIDARVKERADRAAERIAVAAGDVIATRTIRRTDAAAAAEASANMMDAARRRSAELDAERNPPADPPAGPPAKKHRPNRRQRAKIRRGRG